MTAEQRSNKRIKIGVLRGCLALGGLGMNRCVGDSKIHITHLVCHELKQIHCYPQRLASSALHLAQCDFGLHEEMLSMELLLLCSGLAIMKNKKFTRA